MVGNKWSPSWRASPPLRLVVNNTKELAGQNLHGQTCLTASHGAETKMEILLQTYVLAIMASA